VKRRSDRLGETPLAAKLIEIMDEERVGIRQLARIMGRSATVVADLRRGTDLKRGTPINSTPDTIRALARALATDWVKFERDERTVIDPERRRLYFRTLMEAAGYDRLDEDGGEGKVTILATYLPDEVRDAIDHDLAVRVAAHKLALASGVIQLPTAVRAAGSNGEQNAAPIESIRLVDAVKAALDNWARPQRELAR
jgi:hypothetical protein